MIAVIKNGLLLIGTVLGSLIAVELGLVLSGAYGDLAGQRLAPSPAIWERPRNAVEAHGHPDLKTPIKVMYDDDGVRNHDPETTRRKRRIVGFFGDSFTENRRVEDRFSLTHLLDRAAAGRFRVANFGVDAYGIDQSYLRYRKYADLDLGTVVYVFCENDLRNLYETDLTFVDGAGTVHFRVPKARPLLRLMGRLRLPYLIIDAYHQAQALWKNHTGPARNYDDRLDRIADRMAAARKQQKQRLRDAYAESVVADITGPAPSTKTLTLARKFRMVLAQWRAEVTARGRQFKILVLPRATDRDVARKLIGPAGPDVLYLSDAMADYDRYRFKHDVHWNEAGNLKAAAMVLADPVFLGGFDAAASAAVLDSGRAAIIAYYDAGGGN